MTQPQATAATAVVTDMCANIGFVWPKFADMHAEAYNYYVASMLLVASKPHDFALVEDVVQRVLNNTVPPDSVLGVTIGIHPCSAQSWTPDTHAQMAQMCMDACITPESPLKVVGECGLDYFRMRRYDERDRQRRVFKAHVDLAARMGMPLFVHERAAHDDTLAILDPVHRRVVDEGRGVFYVLVHCFTVEHHEDVADAKKRLDTYLDRGYFIGIATGVCCDDDRARKLRSVLSQAGFERMRRAIVVETDTPYMAPPTAPSVTDPKTGRRHRQNSPAFTMEAAIKLAALWRVDVGVVADATQRNAYRFVHNHSLMRSGVVPSSEIDW